MKKILTTLSLILAPTLAFAGSNVTCDGVSDSNITLILIVKNAQILQMRAQPPGSLPPSSGVRLARNNGRTSLYTVSGVGGFLEVQNSVLRNEGGWLTFAGERFECN